MISQIKANQSPEYCSVQELFLNLWAIFLAFKNSFLLTEKILTSHNMYVTSALVLNVSGQCLSFYMLTAKSEYILLLLAVREKNWEL